MSSSHHIVALDIGEKRIGVAQADTVTKFPFPVTTLDVDDMIISRLRELVAELEPAAIVVGYPRNQAGEPTKQTERVIEFAKRLEAFQVPIVWQDESLTSVLAEQYLKSKGKPYSKADIDSHAAAIILGDYLEANHA